MRQLIFSIIALFYLATITFANGVGIVDATNNIYLHLTSTNVNVDVENQIGIINSSQVFKNDLGEHTTFKYGFPLPIGASALNLRWYINGEWNEAVITPEPPDTSLPGGGDPNPALLAYLGEVPLFFDIADTIKTDSLLIVELTYVQFLEYSFGNVSFLYPNDYSLIQESALDEQRFTFSLISGRTIENIQLLSHTPTQLINNGNNAFIESIIYESPANADYEVLYSLSLDELGLFSFSTMQPDTLVPDSLGDGFLVFVAEPDPSETTEVIDKVFTLIVDRSGSMSDQKIIDARNAASFIVEHLNEGDKFNIVDFSSDVSSFRAQHVEYNPSNEADALAYISTFQASGSTNISGAFDLAIPQFSVANDSTANIIIFFTDGQATAGITNTELLVEHIYDLVVSTETEISIFNFGIGYDVNYQLLTLVAQQNNGLAVFLENEELEEVITNFFLQINNPVLLNTQITFTPNVVSEIFPDPLPNLYQGQQMIVAGRYNESTDVTITLSGEAFGQPIEYDYNLSLIDSAVQNYQFLPKVWAKLKIEHLLILYYSYDPNSTEAEELKEQIIQLSIDYGVISPFTSFGNPNTQVDEEMVSQSSDNGPTKFEILGNYPNPFNPSTIIRFSVGHLIHSEITIKIFNSIGELVDILTVYVGNSGIYEVRWDGRFSNGELAPSDVYIYVIDFGNLILADKMILMK